MVGLSNKVAIVTGGGRGLGLAMALGLARAGAYVVITAAHSRDELEVVASEAGRERVHPILADVSQYADCEHVVETAKQHFGSLDLLVNNAGKGMKFISERFLESPTRFWEADPDTWRDIVDTNVTGPFFMARAAIPSMLERGWGRVIGKRSIHWKARNRISAKVN